MYAVLVGNKLVGLACCADEPDLVVFAQDADEVLRGGGGLGLPFKGVAASVVAELAGGGGGLPDGEQDAAGNNEHHQGGGEAA